jgi:hypothetical protein
MNVEWNEIQQAKEDTNARPCDSYNIPLDAKVSVPASRPEFREPTGAMPA